MAMEQARLIDAVREASHFLGGSRHDYDPLLSLVGDARFVLLGEATLGSHELYRERVRITQRLVAELGFNAVVVDGDWPEAAGVNRFLQGLAGGQTAQEALASFRCFPTWRWRNSVVLEFVRWLRAQGTAGFYGLDRYSLCGAIAQVLRLLDRTDPHAAQRTRRRCASFDQQGEPRQSVLTGDVVAQLVDLQRRTLHAADPGLIPAGQNARLLRHAGAYYQSLWSGSRVTAWNLRERHLAETVETIASELARREGHGRVVVWAHNAHLGDARATGFAEVNLGQLLRERHGAGALLVGFTTYDGSVTAAHDWDAEPEKMVVRPAPQGSVEDLFHQVGLPRFVLPLRDPGEALGALHEPLLERAIGAVYRPQTERRSHCFGARVAAQFDAVVHVDRAHAVEPLAGCALPDDAAPGRSAAP